MKTKTSTFCPVDDETEIECYALDTHVNRPQLRTMLSARSRKKKAQQSKLMTMKTVVQHMRTALHNLPRRHGRSAKEVSIVQRSRGTHCAPSVEGVTIRFD